MAETTYFSDEKSYSIFCWSNALLLILSVLALSLPSLEIGPFNIFSYILYLTPHSILLVFLMVDNSEYSLDFPLPLFGMFLFVLYVTCSLFWATDTTIALKKMVIIVTSAGVAMYLYWSIANYRILEWYLSVIQTLTVIGLIIAVVEISTSTHLPVSRRYGLMSYYRSTAWYPNENDLSFFLTMCSFLFFSKAILPNRLRDRAIGTLGYLGCVAVIIQNNSRASLLAIFFTTSILFFIYYNRDMLVDRLGTPAEWPIFTSLLLFSALIVILSLSIIQNPFHPQLDKSFWFRWQSHTAGISFLFETGIGVGVGNFPVRLALSEIPPATQINTHSWFATLISEYGVIGTGIFLLAYGRTLDNLFSQFLKNGDRISFGLLGTLLAFTLAGLGPNDVLVFQIFWIFWGLAIAGIYRGQPP